MMFGFAQAAAIKRLAMRTTNAVIMSGLGIGIGSAILLSLLKHLFGKSSKLEAISTQQETEEDADSKEESPMVFFITSKKSKLQSLPLPEVLSNSFVSTSTSSVEFSPSSSSSSTNQAAIDAQVSEIELKPLPELMLLDEECLRNKLKDDYIVLVIPRKPKSESVHKDEDQDHSKQHERIDLNYSKPLQSQRNSVDYSDALNKLLNQTLKRYSFSQLPALEELKRTENSSVKPCQDPEKEEDADDVREGDCEAEISTATEAEGLMAQCSSWLAGHETSSTCSEGAFMFTSSDMRSIFENELSMSESLANCGSDVMEKLADIEEKLCLVHVDTDDMMSYINAVKKSEKFRKGASFLDHFATSTPTGVGSIDRPEKFAEDDSAPEYLLDFSLPGDLEGLPVSKNFEEWSFEDELGDPNDDSF